jgi:acylglycerol lipase
MVSPRKITAACMFLALASTYILPAAAESSFKEQSTLGEELKLPVHQWSDPDLPAKAIIVAIQAMVFDGRQWGQFARHLADRGYTVYAQDFRGYGAWLTDYEKFGGDKAFHFGQSKEDLTKILTALREKYPEKKIFCIGESLGANMALWEASTEPQLMDGVVMVGLSNKHYPLRPKPYWAITIAEGLYDRKKPFSLKPYMNVLTEDKSVTRDMIDDPLTTKAISPTDLIKANITNKRSIENVESIPSSMPILVINGEKDHVAMTNSLAELMDRIGSEQKKLVVLPDKGHLLLEHRQVDPELAQLIDDWLDQQQTLADTSTKVSEAR